MIPQERSRTRLTHKSLDFPWSRDQLAQGTPSPHLLKRQERAARDTTLWTQRFQALPSEQQGLWQSMTWCYYVVFAFRSGNITPQTCVLWKFKNFAQQKKPTLPHWHIHQQLCSDPLKSLMDMLSIKFSVSGGDCRREKLWSLLQYAVPCLSRRSRKPQSNVAKLTDSLAMLD